jgi:hypothetical protein
MVGTAPRTGREPGDGLMPGAQYKSTRPCWCTVTQTMPTAAGLAAAVLRDGAFAGVGVALLRSRR